MINRLVYLYTSPILNMPKLTSMLKISSKGLPETATTATFKAVRKQYFQLRASAKTPDELRRLKLLDAWSRELFLKARDSK